MKKVYLSSGANPILTEYLKARGYEISFVYPVPPVYAPVNSHPDIYMCRMSRHKIFRGKPEKLRRDYPGDALYNAVCIGEYFIHNLKITDTGLLREARVSGMRLIDVPQGYTKCNMVVVDDGAAVTSDRGIANALKDTDIDLLVVSPGHVLLNGFPYGFLGGASGRVGDELIFHGNLSGHPDFGRIVAFLKKRECKFKYFNQFELEDIGSIIEA